jgi:hypothetical protein
MSIAADTMRKIFSKLSLYAVLALEIYRRKDVN